MKTVSLLLHRRYVRLFVCSHLLHRDSTYQIDLLYVILILLTQQLTEPGKQVKGVNSPYTYTVAPVEKRQPVSFVKGRNLNCQPPNIVPLYTTTGQGKKEE